MASRESFRHLHYDVNTSFIWRTGTLAHKNWLSEAATSQIRSSPSLGNNVEGDAMML